jgi:Na+-transporting NADH:ubiquinone oxidoreductase subunit D
LGFQILDFAKNGGWYIPNSLLLLPPSAFFLIGLLIWAIRTKYPDQQEKADFYIHDKETLGNR